MEPSFAASSGRAASGARAQDNRSSDQKTPLRLHELWEGRAHRVAQNLHDEAGQLLAAVHLKLAEAADRLPAEQIERIQELKEELEVLEVELRNISHEIWPLILGDLGLIPALQALKNGITRRTGIPISLEGTFRGRLDRTVETSLYRIIHEALRMAQRAVCTNVVVELCVEPPNVRCRIRVQGSHKPLTDDGIQAIQHRVSDLSGKFSAMGRPGESILNITLPSTASGAAEAGAAGA